MRTMIGCAGMIAAVAYVMGIVCSLFAREVTASERMMMAVFPAVMAFVAALILFARDRSRHVAARQTVRDNLLPRQDVNDDEFFAHFPKNDPTLIAQTRRAISLFFDVPAEKIHPTDNLQNDLEFSTLEPGFHTFVVYHVFNARNVAPQPFWFKTSNLTDVGDLAKEIQRILDGFETAKLGKTV